MSSALHALFSCLIDSLLIYPLVYCGRVLDRFKLCCFLRRDGRIPDRVYILSCLLSAIVLVYTFVSVLTCRPVVSWSNRYFYNLMISHNEEAKHAMYSYDEAPRVGRTSTIHYGKVGDEISMSCTFSINSSEVLPIIFWTVSVLNSYKVGHLGLQFSKNVSVISPSSSHHMERQFNETSVESQLTVRIVNSLDFGMYSCFLLEDVRYPDQSYTILPHQSRLTRVLAYPGSRLQISLQYVSKVNPSIIPTFHYKVNKKIDASYRQESEGCSPFLSAANYFAENSTFWASLGTNSLTFKSRPNDDPLASNGLHLSICLSPERFGLYTFYFSKTFSNVNTSENQSVISDETTEYPWTLLVEPHVPRGISWLFPGYDLIPANKTDYTPAETYGGVSTSMLSDNNMFEYMARVVMVTQWCVVCIAAPVVCVTSLYFYSKYAPGLMTSFCRYIITTLDMIFPDRTERTAMQPAIEAPVYDLFILNSEDSKYWVNENVVSYTKQSDLTIFWEELLTPGLYILSSSLDALFQAKWVIVVISPECPDDGYFCHQFECLSNRVVEGGLSPLRVMLVRKGNVDVDNFRRHHHQFVYFDWDNTVFRADAFRQKLTQWLNPD